MLILNCNHIRNYGRKSAAHIVEYLPNRIELHTDSSQDGFLILSEIFYPGWMAYVDGEKVPVFRADYLLRAVPLTEGRHHVIFVYRPISFIAGGGITMVTFLLILINSQKVGFRWQRKKSDSDGKV